MGERQWRLECFHCTFVHDKQAFFRRNCFLAGRIWKRPEIEGAISVNRGNALQHFSSLVAIATRFVVGKFIPNMVNQRLSVRA